MPSGHTSLTAWFQTIPGLSYYRSKVTKMHIMPTLALLYAAATLTCAHPPSNHPVQNPLKVITSTGTYIGIINGTSPNVRQFLNIPYALAPVGDRRWLPSVPLTTNSSTVIDATKFGPVCSQHLSNKQNVFNTLLPGFLVPRGPGTTSEDCLSLAIWTPAGDGDVKGLPVIVFMTGGEYSSSSNSSRCCC
jgi:hypothetical protein